MKYNGEIYETFTDHIIYSFIILTSCATKIHKREIASVAIQDQASYKFIDRLVEDHVVKDDLSLSTKNLCRHFQLNMKLPYASDFCNKNAMTSSYFGTLARLLISWEKADKSNFSEVELSSFLEEFLGLNLNQVKTCENEKLETFYSFKRGFKSSNLSFYSFKRGFKSSNLYSCYSAMAQTWLIPTEYLYDANYTGDSYFLFSADFIGLKRLDQ
jgi:hypothetical protein